MSEQIITTPGGERLVIIPEAEFLAMREALEDRKDAEAVRAFHARLAAGEEELVPAEIVNRLIDGENKVRVWREYRGMALAELAEAAEVSAAYLSQIETGKRAGRVDTLKRVATALRLDIDDLT